MSGPPRLSCRKIPVETFTDPYGSQYIIYDLCAVVKRKLSALFAIFLIVFLIEKIVCVGTRAPDFGSISVLAAVF